MSGALGLPAALQWRPAMEAALEKARRCESSGDVPVGAVVVESGSGRIVGRGRNWREADQDPTAHAEVCALRAAALELGSWRLDGMTLVVTLEPCVMCAGAAVAARVDRVVFGAFEDKTGAAGSMWDLLRDRAALHRPEVVSGVLADDSAALLSSFFASRRGAGELV